MAKFTSTGKQNRLVCKEVCILTISTIKKWHVALKKLPIAAIDFQFKSLRYFSMGLQPACWTVELVCATQILV